MSGLTLRFLVWPFGGLSLRWGHRAVKRSGEDSQLITGCLEFGWMSTKHCCSIWTHGLEPRKEPPAGGRAPPGERKLHPVCRVGRGQGWRRAHESSPGSG